MSTILEALQKQKVQQGNNFPTQKTAHFSTWKVVLLTALLVIISLLSLLLYKQFSSPANVINNAPVEAQYIPVESAKVEQVSDKDVAKTIAEIKSKPVTRITFDTKPLPKYEELERQQNPPQVAQLKKPASTPQPLVINEEEPLLVSNSENETTIDYSEVSEELQQRFQRVLEKGRLQGKTPIADAMSSSSDIHQMSVDFQKEVPNISYDSHMYSTIAQDRWIRINGEKLKEGQFDARDEIQVVEILPQRSVFRFGRQSFTLESLLDWQGY